MGFKDYPYERPAESMLKDEFDPLLKAFGSASSACEQCDIIDRILRVRNRVDSMETIARIRFDCDTGNSFYSGEGDYLDSFIPVYDGYVARFAKAFSESRYAGALAERYGNQAMKLNSLMVKVYDDKLLPLLQQENALVRRYDKLLAAARIPFKGGELNLSQLRAHTESADRAERREASEAFYGFFEGNLTELDEIYDKLVHVRTDMARALGYDDFTAMGYDRLYRAYATDDAKRFRSSVMHSVVPLASALRERQRARLGFEKLEYYDLGVMYKGGNPAPMGGDEWQMDTARRMFTELSPETAEFFDFMAENGLYDLPARANKSGGGYCNVIPDHGAPFIFSNSNGTMSDVTTITHESGHAFQVYRTLKRPVLPECAFPAMDACEIHSTSMEYLTWPWMELFFGKDTKKFEFTHISDAMIFIPYSAVVDEFQHRVYSSPDVSPKERRRMWRETEEAYIPYIDYKDNAFLSSGGRFFRQSHIISDPFYYLDYALANVSAMQLWARSMTDRKAAWQDYLRICDVGGREDLFGICRLANIRPPFEPTAVEDMAASVSAWLDGIDDSAF